MAKVIDMLNQKGSDVWTIQPSDTLQIALARLAEHNVGALPVVSVVSQEGGKVVGIFSERDFARLAAENPDCLQRNPAVGTLMTHPVYFVSPEQTVDECMAVMTARKLRHLPVLQDEQLIGLVSIGDVVKHLLADKQETIDVLEHFLWSNLI